MGRMAEDLFTLPPSYTDRTVHLDISRDPTDINQTIVRSEGSPIAAAYQPAATITTNTIRRALINAEMQVFYRPQVDVTCRRISGAKAQVYWNHPTSGWLLPPQVHAVVDATEQQQLLLNWQLQQIRSHRRDLQDIGLPALPVTIECPFEQLQDAVFVAELADAIERRGLSTQQLIIEFALPHTSSSQGIDHGVAATLRLLTWMGLRYTLRVPFSSPPALPDGAYDGMYGIAMDCGLTDSVLQDYPCPETLPQLINSAHDHGVMFLADNVVDHKVVRWLRQQGCEQVRGEIFSGALPFTGLCRQLFEDEQRLH